MSEEKVEDVETVEEGETTEVVETEKELTEESAPEESEKEKKGKKSKKEKIKKEKKPKKEKVKKEGKGKGGLIKKLILVLVLLAIVGAGVIFAPKIIDMITPEPETIETGIYVKYKKNLIFNKYDVTVALDGSSLNVSTQGSEFGSVTDKPAGDYVLTITSSKNAEDVYTDTISITEGSENSVSAYSVKAGWKGLKVSKISKSMDDVKVAAGIATEAETEAVEAEAAEVEVEAAPAE